MTINELARAVHENAVAHGWWDEERSIEEIIALIHSEWSEALEEARAGRPMVYHNCKGGLDQCMCDGHPKIELGDVCIQDAYNGCNFRVDKPEGIAVELIDGCIRILDAFGKYGYVCYDNEHGEPFEIESLWTDGEIPIIVDVSGETALPLPYLVACLHAETSKIILYPDKDPFCLFTAMCIALRWVNDQGIDPLKLLLEKHEYNKTRPYKHGKKF